MASHTGALAGRESAFDAAFRRAGVIRAETSEELFDWARALAWCPLPQGKRVAVLTNAGGPGVTAADALEANRLELARLRPSTTQALRAVLPASASVENPVDMLAGATPTHYATCLHHLLEDDGVDSVMVILPPPPMYAAGGVARAIIPIIYSARKPVVLAVMGERMIQEAVEYFRAARIPEYRFPELAAAALAVLVQRAEYIQECRTEPELRVGVDRETAVSVAASLADGAVPQEALDKMLRAYAVPVPAVNLVQSAKEAAAAAQAMGFPVVLKIASPDIMHKSDVGGVILNLADETAVVQGFAAIMSKVTQKQPDARISGVQVQPMLAEGQDVIVGVVRDPQFGPVLMFGSGGVEVEGLQDVAFALAPVLAEEADYLLAHTWGGRKLAGFRHLPAADVRAVKDVIYRLGQLMVDCPQLAEIEINPLRVFAPGQGVLALDVRARAVLPKS